MYSLLVPNCPVSARNGRVKSKREIPIRRSHFIAYTLLRGLNIFNAAIRNCCGALEHNLELDLATASE